MDAFDSAVFHNLSRFIKKIRHTACPESEFDSAVVNSVLKFDAIKSRDPKVKIIQTENGYDVRLSKTHIAFDFCNYMQEDNQEVNLLFTNDLLEFEPEEELIHKSKIPLWVICPLQGGNRVLIKRAW